MSASLLGQSFKSNSDFYPYFQTVLRYVILYEILNDILYRFYLPPKDQLTKEWLRMVLKGEKRFLPQSEVKSCDVGHYPEVSVKALYEEYAQRKEVEPYMPPKLHKGRTLNKKYFWDVVGSIFPDEISSTIQYANEQRNSVQSSLNKESPIVVSQEME